MTSNYLAGAIYSLKCFTAGPDMGRARAIWESASTDM